MTAPEPTAEHIDAVARVIDPAAFDTDQIDWLQRAVIEGPAHDLLTSTDPAVHAAMLAALVRAGVLRYVATNADGSTVYLREVAP